MVVKRAALLAGLGLAFAALAGCPRGKPGLDGGVPDAGKDTCAVDSDCPDSALFFCNSSTFQCEPSCQVREDCGASHRGPYALAACDTALGCQCDQGRCVKALCSSDAECGALVCRDGECVPPPSASQAVSCQVWPDWVVVKPGTHVHFQMLAWDANALPLVPAQGVGWSAENGSTVTSAAGASAEVALQATAPGPRQAVRATLGTASCAATVVVLANPPPDGAVRALVTDDLTGRPLSGATVVLSTAQSGGGGVAQVTTGDDGLAIVPLSAAAGLPTVTLTAFHPAYGYLTVADYDLSGSRDVSLPLRRNRDDQYGGYRGTFQSPPSTSNAHVGLAGMSAGGAPLELSSSLLLGPISQVGVHIGSTINLGAVPLPAGAFLMVGKMSSKAEVSARGLPGLCTAPMGGLSTAEATLRAGRCGTRAAWGFTADVPVADLPLDALAGAAGQLDLMGLLGRSGPLLGRFSSSVSRDVAFELRDASPGDGGVPDNSDSGFFTTVNHSFAQPPSVPLGFAFVVNVPPLPRVGNGYVDSVLLLGTADVPGRGLVPLGLGTAVNANGDALTDIQAGLPGQGMVAMRMAPAHHGLEGAGYGVLGLAMSLAGADASRGFAVSGLYQPLVPSALPFDPRGAQPLALSGPFLALPRGGHYNFASTPRPGLLGRQFKFGADPQLVGASAVRVVLTDAASRSWTVLMDPARSFSGFQLPLPPVGFEDRTFATAAGDVRSDLTVQAVRLDADPARGTSPLGFAGLVELDAARADRLMALLQAFSSLEYGHPDVQWRVPAQDGQTLGSGTQPLVKVTGFKLGDDGEVQFSFEGCSAAPVQVAADPSQGKGEIPVPLPAGCSGQVRITAELYEGTVAPLPLAPRVYSTRQLGLP